MFRIPSHFGKAGPIFRRYELPGQFATGQPLPPCVREAAPYGASEERREISVYILGLGATISPMLGKGVSVYAEGLSAF